MVVRGGSIGHEVERNKFVPIFMISIYVMREAWMEGTVEPFHHPILGHMIAGITHPADTWYFARSLEDDKFSALVRDHGRTSTVTSNDLGWVHPRAYIGSMIGNGKRFYILSEMINKREIFVSSRRCWVGTSYIHGSNFEVNFELLYVAKWGNHFPVLSFSGNGRASLCIALWFLSF